MKKTLTGCFIPGDSVIHQLDARVKIVCFFILVVAVASTSGIWGYAFAVCFIMAIIKLSGLPVRVAFGSTVRLRLFLIVIFTINVFFFKSGSPIWSWYWLSISEEGVRQGVKVVLNVILIVTLSGVLTSTTAPMETVSALGSLMTPLGILRVPVYDIAMIIGVAIRFIPILEREAELIKKAQTARGARFESRKITERAISFLPLIVPIFLSSFRRADELSLAIEARGYRSAHSRAKKPGKQLCRRDVAALIGILFVYAIQVYINIIIMQ